MDDRIAKNLLIENTCWNCRYSLYFPKNEITCIINKPSLGIWEECPEEKTCTSWEIL